MSILWEWMAILNKIKPKTEKYQWDGVIKKYAKWKCGLV